MPKKLERCVASVMKQGEKKNNAYAICQASIKKAAKGVKAKKGKYNG
jgi:hypothetical protein